MTDAPRSGEPLAAAVVGAGFIGADHAKAYRRRRDVEVVGVVDVDHERAEALAAEVGAMAYRDVAALLAARRPDVASVCVPTGLHRAVVDALAPAGVHLLLEKPMAPTVAECDAIVATTMRAGVTLMVGFTHRFHRELQQARALIADGAIGTPMLAQDVFTFGEHAPWPAWYYDRSLSGGGELMHDGVHLVDRLAWLLATPIVEVTGRTTSYARGIDGVEDGGVAVLAFASGAIASLFVNESTYPLRADSPSVPMPGRCELEIHGATGTIRYRTWHELVVDRRGEPSRTIAYDGGEMDREIDEFVTAIQQRRVPSVGPAEGRRAIAVIHSIYESDRRGAPVLVDDLYPVVDAPADVLSGPASAPRPVAS